MTEYWQLEARARGSDNFLVVDVAGGGDFVTVWDRPGLRFADRASAERVRSAVVRYGIQAETVDEYRVEKVEIP